MGRKAVNEMRQRTMSKEMEMPCVCPECGDVCELNDMKRTDGKLSLHNLVCKECHQNLETDNE